MELLIKSTKDILDEKLNLVERGILITIALCRDSDPRITLAKFKTKVKMRDIKEDLVKLQEKGLIKWAGYKAAKKSIEDKEISPEVKEAVDFMNKVWKRKLGYTSKDFISNLRMRLKENGLEDVKLVIANRYEEWKDDPVMKSNLEPSTVFRPSKFPKYLDHAKRTRVGESHIAASIIGLKHMDEITLEIAQTFIDNNVYNIKIYQCDREGNRRSNGTSASRYGKDIKSMLKMQKINPIRTHRYFYVQK